MIWHALGKGPANINPLTPISICWALLHIYPSEGFARTASLPLCGGGLGQVRNSFIAVAATAPPCAQGIDVCVGYYSWVTGVVCGKNLKKISARAFILHTPVPGKSGKNIKTQLLAGDLFSLVRKNCPVANPIKQIQHYGRRRKWSLINVYKLLK